MQVKFVVRKDNWMPSRPWCADAVIEPGSHIMANWAVGFKTRRSLIEYIKGYNSSANITNHHGTPIKT